MNSSNFIEHEYKHRADNIGLSSFIKLMEELGCGTRQDISSWDHYYVNKDNNFLRFRDSDIRELTLKRKLTEKNNYKRIEINLPLDKEKVTPFVVKEFCKQLGYDKLTSIYKSCFIFWDTSVNYVFYIVYNQDMQELGRFIEIEVNPFINNFLEVDLAECEKKLTKLGISSKHRIKESLFELFVKEK